MDKKRLRQLAGVTEAEEDNPNITGGFQAVRQQLTALLSRVVNLTTEAKLQGLTNFEQIGKHVEEKLDMALLLLTRRV